MSELITSDNLKNCLEKVENDKFEFSRGKVRDSFLLNSDERVLITSDKISAFDSCFSIFYVIQIYDRLIPIPELTSRENPLLHLFFQFVPVMNGVEEQVNSRRVIRQLF